MTFVDRMIGAARLDPRVYEEIQADHNATIQAVAVVALSAVAAGVSHGNQGFAFSYVVQALFMWVVWAGLSYAAGVYLIPEPQTNANLGQMLRTIGFAASPGILRFFGFIPVLGSLIRLVAGVWMFLAMVVAIRQALDYKSLGRAVAVCFIARAIATIMGVILAAMFMISFGSVFF